MNDDIIEIIDDVENVSPDNSTEVNKNLNVEKKGSDVTYNTIEPEKEKIEVLEDYEPAKNKSGLLLVITLFVILILFVIFLPQIFEVFGRLS